MTIRQISRLIAFTRIELLVIVASIAMLLVLVLVGVPRAKEKAWREQCTQNLRQIGLAFRQWPEGSAGWYPMLVPDNQGGAQQSAARGEVFRAFQVASNYLTNPKLLVCPSDNRTAAPDFTNLQSNTNVSYFVGLDVTESYPQMFLAGDRNLEIDGVAAKPEIVTLRTNSVIGWTPGMHKRQGNIALADGSVQGFSSSRMGQPLQATGVATNRLAIP